MPGFGLVGRTVVVAGAGGEGIGTAVCRFVARAGAHVIGLDNRPQALEEFENAVAGTDGAHRGVLVDLRDAEAVDAAMSDAARTGTLGGMVHVTGGMWPEQWSALATMGDDVFEAVLDLNLRSALHTTRAAGRSMVQSSGGGSIVLVTSVVGLTAMPFGAPYAASKAAVLSLARTAALEWGRSSVRVNCVAPGSVRTGKNRDTSAAHDTVEERGALPLGRRGQPGDVAGPVLFLLSDLSAWVTGQVLAVDGGSSARPSFLDDDNMPVFVHDAGLRARIVGDS